MRRPALIVAVAAAVVGLDQITKTWALRHLAAGPKHLLWGMRLNLQFNSGIAFSQATGSTALVTVIALAVVSVLAVVAYRAEGTFTAVLFALLIGGASGNLVDRLFRHHGGAVIDFIDPRWWPVFNVADAAVSIGVALVVLKGVFGAERHHQQRAEAEDEA